MSNLTTHKNALALSFILEPEQLLSGGDAVFHDSCINPACITELMAASFVVLVRSSFAQSRVLLVVLR